MSQGAPYSAPQQPQVVYVQQPPQQQEMHKTATTAMWLGISSMLCGITGPLGLIMGQRAQKEIKAVPGRYKNARHANIAVVTGAIGTVLLIVVVIGQVGENKGGSSTTGATKPAAEANQPGAAAQPTAEPMTFVSESCLDLATKFGVESKLSDLQKEELWPRYKGKNFKWQLKVTEVSSDMFGGFTVQYKCSPKSPSFVQDIQLKYEDGSKSFVMGLQKDSSYEIKGTLGSTSTLLGMTGDGLP